jgi:serine/threonine-protein kinase PknG
MDTAPDITVDIDFIGLRTVPSARARIVTEGWVPPNDDTGGDIALLELEVPQTIGSTTPLRRLPTTWDLAVRTCGFPKGGLKDGMWVDATLSGPCGPGGECVQLNMSWAGRQVRPGFSGAPVFDKKTRCVIGIVVSTYTVEAAGISWMLPVETIISYLPQVTEWVSGAKASDPSLVGRIESGKLDDNLAREIVSWIQRHRDSNNVQITITGNPDSSEAATVRRAISLADREQRPNSADPLVAQAPEGTVPPPGGIDLAVDATGKTPGDVFRRIVERTGIPVDQSTEPTSEILDNLPPMTIVVNGIDDSTQPEALLTEVLEPLLKRGHRLWLAFRRTLSPSLSIARSLPHSTPGSRATVDSTNGQPGTRTWMGGGLVPLPVLDLPDPATTVLPEASFSSTLKLSAGDLVAGRYEVVGCVARGGLGWVYLARDTRLDGNYVALKGQINTNDPWALAVAVSERRFLTTLDHPNIVRIVNFVTHPEPGSGEPIDYIVMEHVGGLPLNELKDMRVDHVIAYGIDILAAFDYLHGRGLLYCDMKPNNVIRSKDRIKIVDLGGTRRFDDRQSVVVNTPGFSDGPQEMPTVRSDIRAVGRTLEHLLSSVTTDVPQPATEPGRGQASFGIGSLRRVLARATHQRADHCFPSAAAMSQQLRGVLREILSLQDGQPRPEPSTVFTVSAALLDAGLGTVPPLDSWTTNHVVQRGAALDDGRPSATAVARGLAVPQVDAHDPAASFLMTVSATDAPLLINQLATFPHESTEIQLRGCRAHLELADLNEARACLDRAEKISGNTDHDWRMAWHHGLLELANNRVKEAKPKFDEVYHTLPGEDVPKLALGFCYEQLGEPADAERCYEAVWRRDRSQASAAFGLARVCLRRADRNTAVAVLDEVPDVSPHYEAARIAAVRILSGRLAVSTGNGNGLPATADFNAVVSRLPALRLDGSDNNGPARDRLTAAVREVALAWFRETGGDNQVNGHDVLGGHVTERGLRKLLERSFRALARQAGNPHDHGVLVDLANAVRPRTAW